MARTTLTKTNALGPFGDYTVAGGADLTMTAADVSNKNQFAATGNDLVVAQNTGATAHTVTITSVADPFGRTKDVTTYQLDAGDIVVFGPFGGLGWQESDGKIYLEANHAEVKFGIVKLP